MSSVIEQKQAVVNEIIGKFNESESIILVDYRGLSVSQDTELRTKLREADVELKVTKHVNTSCDSGNELY